MIYFPIDLSNIRLVLPKMMGLKPLGVQEPLQRPIQSTRTVLNQWLQDILDDRWLILDQLIHPETQSNVNLRHPDAGEKRGRLINLGIQVGTETVALMVTITPVPPNQFTVLVHLHPTGENRHLPPDLKLTLHSKVGKILQEVTAQSHDNYIQLSPFRGETGKRFSVDVSLGNWCITEAFEF